ncbi:hypothetical protein NQD34_006834 [Periophthalmus magnuspinnatus]|nr:hypothetical protein NQD34_006834 [Periophthalmus magnuspinnatus]
MEEFKYLGVLFMGEGRREHEIDSWISAVSAVMRSLYGTVLVKQSFGKAEPSIYRLVSVPVPTYGHEIWVLTEKTGSRLQAATMARRSLGDRVRSLVTRKEDIYIYTHTHINNCGEGLH